MVYRWIDFIQFRLPGSCLLCGAHRAGKDGLDLCPGCLADLPRNTQPCPHCAEPATPPGQLCGHCQRHPPPCDRVIAPWRYEAPLDGLVLRLKSPQGIVAARTLGNLLADHLAEDASNSRPDLILPIPLHGKRLRERGFNQAGLLARRLSRRLDIPWRPDVLEKVRQTEDQRGLDRKGRRKNLRGSFACKPLPAGCHVALVDDVVTTGATSEEAARTLKRAGAGRVEVWALARTP